MSSKEGSYAPLDLSVVRPAQKQRVSYYYDEEVSTYSYGAGHPMKPQRIKMTHSLVMNTGVFKKMALYRPLAASAAEMTRFHSEEYVDFLGRVTPQTAILEPELMFGMEKVDDCPAFEGVFRFNALCAGGSLEGAARLARGNTDIAINWSGGLHHAKKEKASGFCYINDIVLGIMEMLRFFARVLYIDIDFHHGDGVEEAFLTTDRVMTVSFHQYGNVFPFNTGAVGDIGHGEGRGYSVNFPLLPGMNDRSFKGIFESVINQVMVTYRPSAIVLQCGADSLAGDRVGKFNLSMRGHANCVKFVRKLTVPTLVLGGGGYTIRNVARTWAYETGVLVGEDLGRDELPVADQYYEYYAPDFKLDVRRANQPNRNSFQALEATKTMIFENLRNLAHAPSVQMQDVPRSSLAFGGSQELDDELDDADEDEYPDVRSTTRRRDQRIQAEGELSDSDDDEDDGFESSAPLLGSRQSGRLSDRRRNTHDHGEDVKINGHKCESMSEPETTAGMDGDSMSDPEIMDSVDGESTSEPETEAGGDGESTSEPQTKPGVNGESTSHPATKASVDGMLGQMQDIALSLPTPTPAPPPTPSPATTNLVSAAPPAPAPAANRIGYRHPLDDPICESCKKGKVKCDKARPFCGTCVRRARTHLCIYRRLDGTAAPDPLGEAAEEEEAPRRKAKGLGKVVAPKGSGKAAAPSSKSSPAKGSAATAKPSTAKASASTAKPSSSTAKPSASTAKPSASTAKPSASTAKPSTSPTKPSASTKPSAPPTKPSSKPSSPRKNIRIPKEPTSMVTRANSAVSRKASLAAAEAAEAAEAPAPGSGSGSGLGPKRSKLTRGAKSSLAAYAKDEWQEGDFGGLGEEERGGWRRRGMRG